MNGNVASVTASRTNCSRVECFQMKAKIDRSMICHFGRQLRLTEDEFKYGYLR